MKRAIVTALLLMWVMVPSVWSAKDVNAMDDIGFDRSFGYYASGNETINMQNGNVIISIPVSPKYPGPEGSGLDLQLKAIYNSSSWKYKTDERDVLWNGEEWPIDRTALVDFNSMYFSPLGFGWRLHMGRLFRLFSDTASCTSVQYVYEDPSGATHEFGPYCADDPDLNQSPNGVFWALDSSNLMLQVQGYGSGPGIQKVVIFSPSGISYHFDGPVLEAPVFPNRCDGSFEYVGSLDQVLNVTRIVSFDRRNTITIDYCTDVPIPPEDEHGRTYELYYGHLINTISDAFGRTINFQHNSVTYDITDGVDSYSINFPYYTSLTVPVFSGTARYTFNMSGVDANEPEIEIFEPWGEAHGRKVGDDFYHDQYPESDYCPGGISLRNQIRLDRIDIPESYSHAFVYASNGEIEQYTSPLHCVTNYEFRNYIVRSSGSIDTVELGYERRQPSRFICKKEYTNDQNQKLTWKYALTTYEEPDVFEYQLDYNCPNVTNNQNHTSYGNTLTMTGVLDPDENETIYFWKNVAFWCTDYNDPYNFNKPGLPPCGDCPEEDNSYNGRLTNVYYFQGLASSSNLRKEEIYNLAYDKEHEDFPDDPVDPWHGDGMGDTCFIPCKDNSNVFRQNIRDMFKETKFYDENGNYLHQMEKTEYSTPTSNLRRKFYVVSRTTSEGTSVPTIETEYDYGDLNACCSINENNPDETNYKIDFTKTVTIKADGNIVSKTEYIPDNDAPGRIGEKKMHDGEGQIIIVRYDYDLGNYNQMMRETWLGALPNSGEGESGNDLIYHYSYLWGALNKKWLECTEDDVERSLYLTRNTIDFNSGLPSSSTDSSGNVTSYKYDGLSRMYLIEPPRLSSPDKERFITQIDYSRDNGTTIDYYRLDQEGVLNQDRLFQSYHLDCMGNVTNAEQMVYDEEGYTLIPTKTAIFDWKGNEMAAFYPGKESATCKSFYYTEYDCLGRPTRISQHTMTIDENGNPVVQQTSDRVIQYFVKPDTGMFEKIDRDNVGKVRTYFTDLRGNLRQVDDSKRVSGDAYYQYDALGNLIEVIHGTQDGIAERTFRYDWLSRLKESHEPETGTRYYAYYNDGKIGIESDSASFDSDGTKSYLYNKFNLLHQVNHKQSDGTSQCVRQMTYGDSEIRLTGGSGLYVDAHIKNGTGKLTDRKEWNYKDGVLIGLVHQAWTYNEFGEITDEWLQAAAEGFNSEVFRTEYGYNRWGSVSSVKYPSSEIKVNYESLSKVGKTGVIGGAVTGVTIDDSTYPNGVRSIADNVFYTPTGNVKMLHYDNNSLLLLWPDSRNRYSAVGALDSTNNVIFCDTYAYNEVNQINSISNFVTHEEQKYLYLSDGSLSEVRDANGTAIVHYDYDDHGNMTTRTVNVNDLQEPGLLDFENVTYTDKNQIAPTNVFAEGSGAFAYDSNGNVTYNPITQDSYWFDSDNRLLEVTLQNDQIKKFVYDADRYRRIMVEDGSFEMFFYDMTGNNLMEKLRFTLDAGIPELVKNECFINVGKNNIAQLDVFEPVVNLALSEDAQKTVFGPGDQMDVVLRYDFQGDPIDIDLYTLLAYGDSVWFYPTWSSEPDCKRIHLNRGHGEVSILNFTVPKAMDRLDHLYFYSGMIVPGESHLFGNIAIKEFSLTDEKASLPADHKIYVRPGSTSGNGSIGNPYNSIQDAIDFVITRFPSESNRFLIKLFPGIYEMSPGEVIAIDQAGIDLIGSGQNRSIIRGVSPWNSLVLDNGADSAIQGIRFECNIICDNGAKPFFRNTRIINNGSLAGIIATNECELTIVNCLIAGYYAGIALNDSACSVRATTIDSCRGPATPDELPADWPEEWPEEFEGGGIIASCGEFFEGNTDIHIEESIITNCESGISVAGDITVEVNYCNLWNNSINYSGDQGTFLQSNNISQNPLYFSGRDHDYYLSSIGAGQSVNSPCIDAGNPSRPIFLFINGTTRTDGLFDICAPDIGYHGCTFNEVIGIGNINNDLYEVNDPQTTLAKADKSDLTKKSVTGTDVSSIFSTGPKDIAIISENPDGTYEFRTFFQNDCALQQQIYPDSPKQVIDASLSDLDGDGVLDLAVLEASGPELFVNDTSGFLSLEATKPVAQSKAIEAVDFNRDGYKDLLVATTGGVSVQKADDHLVYSAYQLIKSGDTENMVLYDFDDDGDADLVTVDSDGVVGFYRNERAQGFIEVGNPVQVHGFGKMIIQDFDGDGQMDVVVEIAPGVNEVVSVGSIFGIQHIPPGGIGGMRNVRYALFDHLGSTKMLINDQCEVVWPNYGTTEANKLLPFGQERKVYENSPETSFNLNFTNKELDRDLELNYFGARYYHPEIPRFISPDPVGGKPEIPMSWNKYLYCRNDPVNLIDPDGRETQILVPYKEVIGDIILPIHAAVYVDSDNHGQARIYDPAGSFNPSGERGADDSLYDKDANVSAYTKFYDEKVEIFVFDTTPEEESSIGTNADVTDGATGGMCAIVVGNVIRGIGPFKDLGNTLTPAKLYNAMIGLQKTLTKEEAKTDGSTKTE